MYIEYSAVLNTNRPNVGAFSPILFNVQRRLEPKWLIEQGYHVFTFICEGSGKNKDYMKQTLFAIPLNQFLSFCNGF